MKFAMTGDVQLKSRIGALVRMDGVKAGLHDAAMQVRDHIAYYPPQKHHPMHWYSEKQRRFVMAQISEGNIQIPYKRSTSLRKNWRVQVQENRLRAIVTNDTSYAPFVHQDENQYWMHLATGWRTRQETVNDPGLLQRVEAAINRAIDKWMAK